MSELKGILISDYNLVFNYSIEKAMELLMQHLLSFQEFALCNAWSIGYESKRSDVAFIREEKYTDQLIVVFVPYEWFPIKNIPRTWYKFEVCVQVEEGLLGSSTGQVVKQSE